ncbi:MAG: hypothetical protein WAX69_17730, partial [Victivallales bacterium]
FLFLFMPFAYSGGGRNRVSGGETTIAPVKAPIAVDGDLDDWDQSRAKMLTLASGGGEDSRSPAPLEAYRAKILFQYDEKNLYAALWWTDPTPLGPEKTGGCLPPGDGLILSIPGKDGVTRMAFWRDPAGTAVHAIASKGDTPLGKGTAMKGVGQAYKITGADSYSQELQIPWNEIGVAPEAGIVKRIGVELCFGGLDPAAGYKAWSRDTAAGILGYGNRWGGNMCWGFIDGIRSPDQILTSYDPATGAKVRLMPKGTAARANPAVMYDGNEQTRTTEMIAIPAQAGSGQAGKITIDGKMEPGEWDAKSATRIASEPTLFPNRYAVDVHWAYDEKGLYAGLNWRTGGSHLNINNPAKTDHGYDGGDAVQIRLGTDRVSHVDAWYCEEVKTPAVSITYGARFNEGSEPDALSKGAALAIQPATAGGYTEELFLPWSLITKDGKALKEGDEFQVVFDVFFSGLEGNRIPYIVNARVEQPSGVITLPFTAPENGYYTVAIVDTSTGQAIRRLANIEKMRKGQKVVEWDGLDDSGVPARPGKYEYRGLRHDGVGLKYLMTLNNPGTPSWQTDDGKGEWGGDHCPPQTVAADDAGVYLGWPSAEDGNGIIGCDPEGKKLWGFFQTPFPSAAGGAAILAADGQNLYFANEVMRYPQKGENELAYFKTVITCLDKNTGYRRGFSTAKPYHEISTHDTSNVKTGWYWDLHQAKKHSLDTCGIRDDYFFSGHCAGVNLAGLAAKDGKIYVSLRVPGEIAVYSSTDMTELARWKLAKPAGLAFSKDGKLFAISGQTVVQLNLADGKATPVISSGLDAPTALAIDADGALYVSDWGAAQCVKVFDTTGKQVRTIGKAGGRPWSGVYDPDAMLLPRGLAIDKNGKLWVAEDENMPRRVSAWDAKSGKFIREFIGGTTYGGTQGGLIDPSNPDRAYSDGTWFNIDLKKEGYRPLLALGRRLSIDNYMSELNGNNGHAQRIMKANGRRYLSTARIPQILIGELKPDGSWQPSVVIGGIFNRGDNPEIKPEKKLIWRETLAPAIFAKHAGENYIWTDANADGLMQEQEFQWRKQEKGSFPCWVGHWGVGMFDKDMDAYIGGEGKVFRFPFHGWNEDGSPKYDINDAKVVSSQEGSFRSVCVDSRKWVITVNPAETRKWGDKNQTLSGFDTEGRLRWSIPTSEDYRKTDSISGEGLMGPVDAGGELGEIVGVTQWHGLHVPLVTTDGLLVAKLLRDPAEGGEPGPDVYKGETIQCLNKLDDGRVILAHGKNAHHMLQVTGLENVKRFSGSFELTEEQAKLALARVSEQKAKADETAPILVTIKKNPPVVDGKLDDWDWNTASAIGSKDGTPRAEVAMQTSGKNLYAAFKVFKKGAYVNTAKDDPSQFFLTGDAVELRFRAEPAVDPKDKKLSMGDCRVVIGKKDGKPVAVLYRAVVPNAKNPAIFRNPAGTEVVFDAVEVLKDAVVTIIDTNDGYVVEASLPIDFLGGNLWPNRIIPGDAGVIIADSTGRRVARICRFNKDTQVVNDIPTEAALQPEKWGTFLVDGKE